MQLQTLRDLPAETADGVRVPLLGNIEFPHEVDLCLEHGAGGIGLYRTEFLYLGSEQVPSEEDHYQAYASVVQRMQPRPVMIRTLDIGADKVVDVLSPDDERNPCLGLRSIRLSLRNLPLFRTQLRAILRASTMGDVRIMFPLISTLLEFRQAKMVLADVMEDLEEHGLPFNREVPVGMMVEVPSAVMMIDHFVEEADFLSIGTNDLIQYTLAVDRGNKDVASLYTASDPAVLKLINMAVKSSNPGPGADQFVRTDERQSDLHDAAVGAGPAAVERAAQRDTGNQEDLSRRDHRPVRGGQRQGADAGARPRREALS